MTILVQNREEAMQQHLRAAQWKEAITLYEGGLCSSDEQQHPGIQLGYAIALIRTGRVESGLNMLTPRLLTAPSARIQVRRFLVAALSEAGQLEVAAAVLDRILEAHPDSVDDLRLLGSVLGRLGKSDQSLDLARRVLELDQDDEAAHAAYLQRLLKAGRASEAGDHARALGYRLLTNSRLAVIGLLALTRSGQSGEAARIALSIDVDDIIDEQLAAAVVRALTEANHAADAIEAGEALLQRGWDEPTLRSYLGQAYMNSDEVDRYAKAAEHFEAGITLAPSNGLMHYALGEALLRGGRYDDALAPLEKAVELQPNVAQARALYARALKQAGRYAEAASEFRALVKLEPSSANWQRYAAGALAQAGQRDEASALFDDFVSRRGARLPDEFEQGLSALWERVDEVKIPKERLDWAWALRNSSEPVERSEWERAAKWGHLADHYLLDWLECRSDRVHEPMLRLADLDELDQRFQAIDRSKGLIIASAHVGAMYTGPLAMELLEIPTRWLASTPSVARTSYGKSLISTSDQDEIQVARTAIQSLKAGYAVIIAVDGAINLAAPRVEFAGQEITYSSFAARTAYRQRVPSVFSSPRWEGDRIAFTLERLPDPEHGESAADFARRWREAYLRSLRAFLGGDPRNLRLSGGIWRHIRPS